MPKLANILLRLTMLTSLVYTLLHPLQLSAQTTPVSAGFTPLEYWGPSIGSCRKDTSPEFHPLRPYPASPCDSFIPRKVPEASLDPEKVYLTFSCNNTLELRGYYRVLNVVPRDGGVPCNSCGGCDDCGATLEQCNGCTNAYRNYWPCGGKMCLVHRVYVELELDFDITKFPIIGNVQDPTYPDAAKTNSYLSWYLNGAVQHSEQVALNPNNPDDMKRLTTYSGPVKKLLAIETQNDEIRFTLHLPPARDVQVHNYIISNQSGFLPIPGTTRLQTFSRNLLKNIPLGTLEDTTSEIPLNIVPEQQPPNSPHYIIPNCRPFEVALNLQNSTTDERADSRIYPPHVRGNDVLSDELTSTFRPQPTSFDPNDPDLISRQILPHQGLNPGDNTPVQRLDYLTDQNTRNTEIGGTSQEFPERYKEPLPPRPDANNPLVYDPQNPICEEQVFLSNPGDDLVGQQNSNSTFVYYQHFEWTPQEIIKNPCNTGCKVEHQSCLYDSDCCWVSGGCIGAQPNAYPYPIYGTCATWPRTTLTSKARVHLYTKTPLVERLYENLVIGPQSVLRRFLPQRPDFFPPDQEYIVGENDIENTLPGSSTSHYDGSTGDLSNLQVWGGDGGNDPEIYFDRLGSLSNHFLGDYSMENYNLQRLLRPRFYPYRPRNYSPSQLPNQVPGGNGSCTVPTSGPCSLNDPATNISGLFSKNPQNAAMICNAESGSNPLAVNTSCPDYSVGLFQINLYCHPSIAFTNATPSLKAIVTKYGARACYDAFCATSNASASCSSMYSNPVCSHGGSCCSSTYICKPGLLAECVQWLQDPANNAAYASVLSNQGANFSAWSTAFTCGIY